MCARHLQTLMPLHIESNLAGLFLTFPFVLLLAQVLLSFESTEREQKGKSRKFSRRLTRGRSTGTYSAADSQMSSPVISSSTASYKIPDIDRDPLGNAGDPEYRASTGSFKALRSFLPDIPRLSLKNLRSPAPAMNSAREQRDTRCPSWQLLFGYVER